MFCPVPHSDLSRKPRASSEIAVVSWYISCGSQDIVDAKFVGKLVACTPPVTPPLLVSANIVLMPCWPSLQYVYCWTPSRGIAGALLVFSWPTFSASVIRDTRSAARSANEYLVSRYTGVRPDPSGHAGGADRAAMAGVGVT